MDVKIQNGRIRKIIDNLTGGYNLFEDPTKIKENEFTQFENLITFENGRFGNANKRKGFERWNTNRTVSTNPIRSIFETIFKTKATSNRILIKTSNSLEYCESSSGAFSSIATGLADSKMSALLYKDNVYIANMNNGDDTNKFYDGTNYYDMGVIPCYQSFSVEISQNNSVNITAGYYTYLIAFLYDNNMESAVVFKQAQGDANFADGVGTEFDITTLELPYINNSATAKKLNILSIPTGNSRVTGRVVYRTKVNGTTFYFHSIIRDNTTTVLLNDDVADSELGDEYNGGDGFKNILKPYKSRWQVLHQRRLWQANLKEDQYTAPDVSLTTLGSTSGSSGNISQDATRSAIYSYKFANDIRVMRGKLYTGTPGEVNLPYAGIFGALSSVKTRTTSATDDKITMTGIPIDTFCLRTAIFRNCCQFISNITVVSTTLTVTVGNARVFKSGESVTISGVAGFTSNPNGTYTISNITNTTFDITHTIVGGAFTASTGVVQGSNYYVCGFSKSGAFTDGLSDTTLVGFGFLVETSTGNKSFKSSVIASDIDQPDIQPAGNFINIGQDDGEEIMGIYSDQRRLIVFKENNIYEIDTTYNDISLCRARRIVKGIGANDGFAIVQTQNNEFIFLGNDGYIYHWNGYGIPVKASNSIHYDTGSLTFTNIDGGMITKYNWVIFTYSTASLEGNVLVYDLNHRDEKGIGTWYHFKKNGTNLNLCFPYETKSRELIFGHRSAGYLMKYGTNNQDNLWSSGTTFGNVQIMIKIQTKTFRDFMEVKKILSRIYTSGAGASNGLDIYYGNESGETPVTATFASGFNKIDYPMNLKGREFYFRLENDENIYLTIKELGFDYIPVHRDAV